MLCSGYGFSGAWHPRTFGERAAPHVLRGTRPRLSFGRAETPCIRPTTTKCTDVIDAQNFCLEKKLSRCSNVGMIKILKHKSLFTKTQFAKGLKIRERSWKKKFLAVTLVHEED